MKSGQEVAVTYLQVSMVVSGVGYLAVADGAGYESPARDPTLGEKAETTSGRRPPISLITSKQDKGSGKG